MTTRYDLPASREGRRTGRHPLDVLGRFLMLLTSRRFEHASVPWLVGPSAQRDIVGHGWVERMATELGGTTSVGPDHGLLSSFASLAGPMFDPCDVDHRIADFYEHTTRWRLDLWSEWSAYAWPFGRVVSALWSQRLKQLSLPMRPLDVSYGMDSRMVHVHDANGDVAGAAWLCNMRKTGSTTYSGLHLRSPLGRFESDGAYLVLERKGQALNARRVPIAEHFHLFVDDGDIRADHTLKLWHIPAVRLHYRMRPAG